MELDVAVGEPDVGAVRIGQRVSFSVLAYPGRTFVASIDQVRQNPTIVNNVTTYDTVAFPSNRDGALRPGMTANVQITVKSYPNATVLPLAALQWRPSAAIAKRYHVIATPSGGEGIPAASSAWGATGESTSFAVSVGARARCYVLDGDTLRGVNVTVLAIDGTRVGIKSASDHPNSGDRVVVDAP
jgi:HlyD family secretion protein